MLMLLRSAYPTERPGRALRSVALPLVLLVWVGCGANKPQATPAPTSTAAPIAPVPTGPPPPEPIETGKDCAKATSACGGGACVAKINNSCDTPITCELDVLATCSAETTTGEARSKGRGTIPAKTDGQVTAQSSCEGGVVQLTVAESMKVQPADVAVGYRVARGGRQWLIYRSLAPPKNRTLLGHNLSTELLVARFTREGEVKPLLEIE